MSRVNPLSKHRLLYLGEVSEPPDWLPSSAQTTIAPILNSAQIGMFILEHPDSEELRYLEEIARQSGGAVSVLKTTDADFCVCIGPRSKFCETSSGEAFPAGSFGAAVERYACRDFPLALRNGSFSLGERTRIMGILNVTPDSFSDGGRFHNFDAAVAQAEKMAEEGADIIDIGGESTRPGSDPVTLEEEAERVLPVIEHISKNLSVPISIDTCKAEIARRALDAGAEIVNDVSSLRFDEEMVEVVRASKCPVILMHMLGTPKTMQKSPAYDALMPEIISFLSERVEFAVKQGVAFEQLIIDPGVGFGKTVEHNLEILLRLKQLRALSRPILIGPSRKSTIGEVLEVPAHDRVEGTAAAVALGIANGAHIVRVHDVKEITRVAKMADAIMGKRWN
jgi:dihydropteroate synthase